MGTDEAGTAAPTSPDPVAVEPVDQVVLPIVIAQTQGDVRTDWSFSIDNLIDGSGLSASPTVDNLSTVLHNVFPSIQGGPTSIRWETDTKGSPDYFGDTENHADPQFTLTLDQRYSLGDLVIWGAQDNANEASNFTVEFSTDGGTTYSAETETVQTSAVLASGHARLAFDADHEANFVRLTITNNAKGRGFSGAGGDRVALGEIRFIGTPASPSGAPVVAPGSLVALLDTAATLDLSTLVTGAEEATPRYTATDPSNGTVSVSGSVVTYTPNTGYFGVDRFTYTVTDEGDASATATGVIGVTVHRAPTAQDVAVATPLNTALNYDLSPLASDPDGDTLEWSVGSATHGTALLNFVTGGSVNYTPDTDFAGADSFVYTVRDSHGVTATGTISVAVGHAGSFGRQTSYEWTANPNARSFAGDFNDDGDADIGVWESDGDWVIRYGNGAGSFDGETDYSWNANPASQPVAGDFDGDGNADLGVFYENNGTGAQWYIRYGNGSGGFSDETYYLWTGTDLYAKPFVADFDGDGHADIGVWTPGLDEAFLATQTSANIGGSWPGADWENWGGGGPGNWHIRYGNGAGGFSGQTLYKWVVDLDAKPFAGDFNGDGLGDIGVWESDGTWRIRYGDGSGQFGEETSYAWTPHSDTRKFVVGDFNGDDNTDIGIWRTDRGTWYIRYLQNPALARTAAAPEPQAEGSIDAVTLTVGRASYREDLSGYFSHGETYTASSSAEGVARVRVTGSLVTIAPVAAGTATVTVTAANAGTSDTAEQTIAVTVQADSVPTEPVVAAELPDQNVVWTSRGTNDAKQGMPIGNGTQSALVWAGSNRDLYLLLGANDFWDSYVHLNHPGRIRIRYSGTPFATGFRQELKLKEGEIVVTAGTNPKIETRIWADANAPVIHVESKRLEGEQNYDMEVRFESLRPRETSGNTSRVNYYDISPDFDSPYTPRRPADTTETDGNVVWWYQRNTDSYFDELLEHLGQDESEYPDLLTGRTYGGRLEGDGFTASGTAISKSGGTSYRAAVTLHSEVVDSVATWKTRLNALRVPLTTDIDAQRAAHRTWWTNFWNRSYIFAEGDSDATDLTQKYVLARYRQACAGRTPGMPLRFNGSLFWVGRSGDSDWRPWNSYHAFNQRFAFWGMLPSGDFDLMQPHFDLYANSLQLAKDRVSAWWGPNVRGAMWPEIVGLFGHTVVAEYGWLRNPPHSYYRRNPRVPPAPILSTATRHLYASNAELVAMLLDHYEYTQDAEFAKRRLLPIARAVLTFYFTNWEVVSGKLFLDNLYSGERDWNVDNPTADVAGLRKMLAGLLALPNTLTTAEERADWTTKQGQLPAIPIADEKFKTGDNMPNSETINNSRRGPPWQPSANNSGETNNQNLYPIFPLRLYGYGQNDLAIATKSYNERNGKYPTSGTQSWRHDATHAAYLGLINEAKTMVKASLGAATKSGWRFPTFSNGDPDGDPSVERPAIGKIGFQAMLMHPGAGDAINLLNAWPSNWNVQFKLHAPEATVVKGSRAGNNIAYTVIPASRASDVAVRGSLTENERLTLSVAAVTGDNVIDTAEKSAGFSIAGSTGSVSGATVSVTLGGTDLGSVTSGSDGAWSVNVPANAAYITGTGVDLRVTAGKPGYLDATAVERTLTVSAVNAAPIARSGVLIAVEGSSGMLDLSSLFSDADNDALMYTFTEPSHGRLSLNGTVVTYTPDSGYTGSDAFTVTASDGSGATASAIIVVTDGNHEIVTPTAIALIETATDPNSGSVNTLIDGSGLSATPTLTNLDTVTHSAASGTYWYSALDIFDIWNDASLLARPKFTLTLDRPYPLRALIVWGLHPNTNIQASEAQAFRAEFSTDGGQNYREGTVRVSTTELVGGNAARLDFDQIFIANHVRMRIVDNASNSGFTSFDLNAPYAGLSELRFVAGVATTLKDATVVGDTLTLTYGEALDGDSSSPAPSAFTVSSDTAPAVTVTGARVSGATVVLTLSRAVAASETVTVSYTARETNPVQDVRGFAVGNLASVSVTTPPQLQSAVVAGNTLTLSYDEVLDGDSSPARSAFTVTSNRLPPMTVTRVSVSGTTVVLTLSRAVSGGETVTVSYTAPTINPVQDVPGFAVGNLASVSVTTPPQLQSATVVGNGNTLTLSYDEALDEESMPAARAFTVTSDTARAVTVTVVVVSGTTVVLTLNRAVGASETVTVSYTAPPTNPIQDADGNDAGNLAGHSVGHVAASASITAGDLTVTVSATGRITALTGSDGADYLASGYTPALLKLIVADSTSDAPSAARQLLPAWFTRLSGPDRYVFWYDSGRIQATVRIAEHQDYASFELISITNLQEKDVRVAMWGPYELTIDEQVADVVGVAYSRDFAIGIQAANEKTFAGAPYEFTDASDRSSFDRSADSLDPALGRGIGGQRNALNKYWVSAARLTTFGSVLQAYSRDYTADRRMKVAEIDQLRPERLIKAITDTNHPLYPVRMLTGSKIALFGLRRRGFEGGGLNRREVFKKEILGVIRAIELGEGLPYTTGNGGVWSKFAENKRQKILNFYGNANNAAAVLSAGLDSQYVWLDPAGVFRHNGFEYAPGSGNVAALRDSIRTVQNAGVRWGNHILPGFAHVERPWTSMRPPDEAPLDRFISTRARDLAGSTSSTVVGALTASSTTITVAGRDERFRKLYSTLGSPRRGYVRIGDEIVAYTGAADHGSSNTRLSGVSRGAFGTTAATHSANDTIYALAGFLNGYNSFFWGSSGVTDMAEAVSKSINDTGMDFISLDGIESYWFDMYTELGANVFYKALFDTLTSKELSSEASRLSHYNWHFHDRWMWGETNSRMLQGTYDYQFANIVMRSRNFLPTHTGGFYGSNNTSKDFEWLGSKIAAMDAGTLIKSGGFDNDEKSALKRWNQAAEAGAFSDLQRARMLPWERAYALQEVEAGHRWRLLERGMRLTFGNSDTNNSVSRVDYGHTDGTPELTNPFYVARPWAGFPTRNVAGDALVTASSERAPDFQADNAVDGQIGYHVSSQGTHYRQSEVSEWQTAADDTERWIELTWDSPQRIRAVLLSDRSHPANNVTGYRLEFSAGSPITGSSLPSRGRYHEHSLLPRESTTLKIVITSHSGSTPGLGEIVVIADDPSFKGHLAKGASIQTGYSGTDGANLFDGNFNTRNTIYLEEGLRSVVIDLEDDKYWVDGLNVWHYYDDANRGRQYRDVIYQLSPHADFSSEVITVFNNDSDNSAGQGTGRDPEFGLRPDGKPVYFPPVKARYLRLWTNGNNWDRRNQYNEVEVYGMKNLASGITPTTNGNSANISRLTDGNYRTGHVSLGGGKKYVQIDLGWSRRIDSLRVWHYFGDRRRYHDVIFQLSDDSTFNSGVTTVFNNDTDNSSSLGVGTDGEYYTTATGKIVHFEPVQARYVRLYSKGNTISDNSDYVEIMVGHDAAASRNRPPILDRPVDQSVDEDNDFEYQFDAASDPEGDDLSYAATLLNGEALPEWLSFDGQTRTFSGTPLDSDVGRYTVRITVTDNGDPPRSADADFVLTVNPVNDPPIARPNILLAPNGAMGMLDLSTFISDPENDQLSYAFGNPAHGSVTLNGTELTYTPGEGYAGTDSFTITVTDTKGASTTTTIVVSNGRGEIVTPTGIELLPPPGRQYPASTNFYSGPITALIDGSGLSAPPTLDNYDSLTHSAELTTLWYTRTASGVSDYFAEVNLFNQKPVFSLTLDRLYSLSSLVIWGMDSATCLESSEAAQFEVEFSTDGGETYLEASETIRTVRVVGPNAARFSFSRRHLANHVRITIPGNAHSRGHGRGSCYGTSVALSELRFIAGNLPPPAPEVESATVGVSGTTLIHFTPTDDPEGDRVSYRAELADGSPLPDWLVLQRTELAATPDFEDVGTYTVRLIATDDGAPIPASSSTTFSLTVVCSERPWGINLRNSFRAGDLTVTVSSTGRITAVTGTDGANYLAAGYTPPLLKLIVADSTSAAPSSASQLLPNSIRFESLANILSFDHGIEARVTLLEREDYASLRLDCIRNPQVKDIRVAMWGPYELTIDEQVADVVGVAYSRDFAIGIQAANEKTFAGAPYEFTDASDRSSFDRSADSLDPALGRGIGGQRNALNKYWVSAARLTTFGSVLQAYSRDYTADRRMKVAEIDQLRPERLIKAITDTNHPLYPVRMLTGSKIALFGLRRRGFEGGGLNRREVFKKEILGVIHAIELGEGLPYTTGNGGVWSKFAENQAGRRF